LDIHPPTTKVAILTSPGRAAIATVAVWGPDAISIVAERFTSASGRPLEDSSVDQILFGRWGHASNIGDEEEIVVILGGADSVELHCHGGHFAADSIATSVGDAGASRQPPAEWVRHHADGSLEAEAAIQLAQAESDQTAAILLDQCRGALRRELEEIVSLLIAEQSSSAIERLEALSSTAQLGQRLVTPWRVVVAGAPNAGKSSLVNRLLGFNRSIVHAQPGTTRDRVSSRMSLDGWPIELLDTAGLRLTTEALESAGIDLAVAAAQAADLVIWVHDLNRSICPDPIDASIGSRATVQVANKADLLAEPPGNLVDWVVTSALSGTGVERLAATIVKRLIPIPPQPGAPILFTQHQGDLIRSSLQALVPDGANNRKPVELLQTLLTPE
jgi:tRNA modification GTPase